MKIKKTYFELLQDPRWQKKRLEILTRDNYTCVTCGDTTNTLHVHHKAYLKDTMPWDYDNRFLITVCDECHDIEHYYIEKNTVSFLVNGYSNDFMGNLREALDKYDNDNQRVSFEAGLNYFLSNKDMINFAISLSNDIDELNEEIRRLNPPPF